MASTNSAPPTYDVATAQPSPWAIQSSSQRIPSPPVFTPPVPQNPNYDGPEDFLVLVIIITIVCGFLNLLSLVFGMIAIVMAAQARIKKGAYDYPNAQRYSVIGVVLSMCTIIWTGVIATVLTGWLTAAIYLLRKGVLEASSTYGSQRRPNSRPANSAILEAAEDNPGNTPLMHHVVVGLTWLKKRLAALGLKRRNVVETRLTLVHQAIKVASSLGEVHVILLDIHHSSRSTVMMLLAVMDPIASIHDYVTIGVCTDPVEDDCR
ncbi:hypothetical protein EMCRGX_G018565 [Ephydatia muelleri]